MPIRTMSHAPLRRHPFHVVLFGVYAVWSLVAILEIVLRRGHSPLPGILADHNGNIAVSGFIMAAAFPGAALLRIGRRRRSAALRALGRLCLPVAAIAWGTFFVVMEFLPLYGPNVPDWRDVPGSLFGLGCGTFFGWQLQRRLSEQRRTDRRGG